MLIVSNVGTAQHPYIVMAKVKRKHVVNGVYTQPLCPLEGWLLKFSNGNPTAKQMAAQYGATVVTAHYGGIGSYCPLPNLFKANQ